MHDENSRPMTRLQHICWDGCMFPNSVMNQQETWNNILSAMLSVREAQGWQEEVSAAR
jgi:hypothetical protein